MKRRLLLANILFLLAYSSFSQGVGIGTSNPDPSAALDITATGKGLLIPRISFSGINAIANPARGLLVYDSVANQLLVNMGTPARPNWQPVVGSNSGWDLNGNSGTNTDVQFVGTTDNQPLRFRVNNIIAGELSPLTGNISFGLNANRANTTGFSNTAIGRGAMEFNTTISNTVAIGDSALFNNRTDDPQSDQGSFNTAIGSKALFTNTIGSRNTATGFHSLFSNTNGTSNAAFGRESLFSNTQGSSNTALGDQSLRSNTTGSFNTTVGQQSLFSNTTGSNNTAVGTGTLISNTKGSDNTAVGVSSLSSNVEGTHNTAVGSQSLQNNGNASENTALGFRALMTNTVGINNTAVGSLSLQSNDNGNQNTAFGTGAMTNNISGGDNIAIGFDALGSNLTGNENVSIGFAAGGQTSASAGNTSIGSEAGNAFIMGDNNTLLGNQADVTKNGITNSTALGNGALVNASNKIRLGNSAITVIEGQVPFTTPSDGRFKYHIQEDVKGLAFIMQLRPVTYQFDVRRFDEQQRQGHNGDWASSANLASQASYIEASSIRRTGFIAQEVERAADESGYDFSGIIKPKTQQDHYSLSYEAFVVPLVKALQEQQHMIEELNRRNDDLSKRILILEKGRDHE